MKWKCFSEFSSKWFLKNCIVRSTQIIDPSQTYATVCLLTMGGPSCRNPKNITNTIIPPFSVGYFEKLDSGFKGSLIHFDLNLISELVEKRTVDVNIHAIKLSRTKVSILLREHDMNNLQVFLG